MTKSYQQLFDNNQKWADQMVQEDSKFFDQLAAGQSPNFLWIGCSDSRVPANQITGTAPGDVFVHRNIANMVIHTDMNMLSVLDYAVNALQVKHIIVCGHYGCGGIKAALGNKSVGLIDNWLRHIKDVYRLHREELDKIKDDVALNKRMVELNVQEQVHDLASTTIVQGAWAQNRSLQVHGLVFDIGSGRLIDLNVTTEGSKDVEDRYVIESDVIA